MSGASVTFRLALRPSRWDELTLAAMLVCQRGASCMQLASKGVRVSSRPLNTAVRKHSNCIVGRPDRRLSTPLKAMLSPVQQQAITTWQQSAPYVSPSQDKEFVAKYTASCMCGDVQYAVDCDPVAAKYCHCTSCQRLHGESDPASSMS